MESKLKKLLDDMKCPLCGSAIDIDRSKLDRAPLYKCVNNYDHYVVDFNFENCLRSEIVNIYDDDYKYKIIKSYLKLNILTEISILKINPSGRLEFNLKNKTVILKKDLFDFKNFNTQKAIDRIKLIFTFN